MLQTLQHCIKWNVGHTCISLFCNTVEGAQNQLEAADDAVLRAGWMQRWLAGRHWPLLAVGLLLAILSVQADGGAHGHAYSAICAVGHNENAFLKEWVEYHLCLGAPCMVKGP